MKNKFNLKSLRVYILSGICGVLAVLSIFMTIETATSGAEIADLQKKEAQLTSQQQDIEENLVENLSVNSLREKSTEMGFTKVGNLVYVANAENVANGVPVARLPSYDVKR
jgi:cell division protein FtsL